MHKGMNFAKKLCVILLGNTLLAFGIAVFVIPNGLITGGSTGIALVVNHFTGLYIPGVVFCFNLLMFLTGLAFLGKLFAFSTVISSAFFPVMLSIFQSNDALQELTSDTLLAAVYAGLFIGGGIGIVLRMGASTGGMDVPPLILHKKLGLPVSVLLYGFDSVILLLQITFSSSEQILYGILVAMLTSIVLNRVLLTGKNQTQVMIISEHYEEINGLIQTSIDRGSTLINAVTGYYRNEQKIVLTVISHRELPRLNQMVLAIDPKAFMVISQVNEVKGRGFTLNKKE